ncbi:hypothetical protein Tco_0959655 [Tanacetum coccineum]
MAAQPPPPAAVVMTTIQPQPVNMVPTSSNVKKWTTPWWDRLSLNFLTVIPVEGLGQHMSALEYRTILKYRLMIPLFPVDEPCPVCLKVCLDSFARISSKKEAPVNFLTDPLEGRSTLRSADILVFGWAGGKHACVDLTGVSPLVGLRDNGFVSGQAVLKAESGKVAKHEKACLENQHVFIPFAFDTFGFLAPEAEEFLTRV